MREVCSPSLKLQERRNHPDPTPPPAPHMQVKYAKLRGTPGSASDKLSEAEREVTEAEGRVRDARIRCAVVPTALMGGGHGWDRLLLG